MKRLLVVALALLAAVPAGAQPTDSRAEFEERLAELRSQIDADQLRLQETRSRESASRRALDRIERDIAVRRELVSTFEARVETLTSARDSMWTAIQVLEDQIAQLKADYRARATHAYKYGRQSDLAMVLSSSSINEMVTRIKWFNRFSDSRRRRVEDIGEASAALNTRKDELQEMLQQTEETLRQARREQESLRDQQQRRERIIGELRQAGGTLAAQLEARRRAAGEIQSQIAALIAAERRAAGSTMSAADAEAFAALSGSFADNRGRLPWPAGGTLVEPFGEVVNPVYNTRTTNQGLLVATPAAAEVRSVFEGRVIIVDVMPEYGTYVVIGHGDYATLYANLSRVNVGLNQTITAGDTVGRAGTDTEPRGAGYLFGIWGANGQFIDPAPWLSRR